MLLSWKHEEMFSSVMNVSEINVVENSSLPSCFLALTICETDDLLESCIRLESFLDTGILVPYCGSCFSAYRQGSLVFAKLYVFLKFFCLSSWNREHFPPLPFVIFFFDLSQIVSSNKLDYSYRFSFVDNIEKQPLYFSCHFRRAT